MRYANEATHLLPQDITTQVPQDIITQVPQEIPQKVPQLGKYHRIFLFFLIFGTLYHWIITGHCTTQQPSTTQDSKQHISTTQH